MGDGRAGTRSVVVRRSVASGCVPWGVVLMGPGFGVLVLGALALSPNPLLGRLAAVVGVVLLVWVSRWWLVRIWPPASTTLELHLGPDGVTARKEGEEVWIPRQDVWFIEVHEVHWGGVMHMGVVGHDGSWRGRWITNWGMLVSSLGAIRRIRRAGYAYVLGFDERVWWAKGVDDRAKATLRALLRGSGS